MLLLGMEPAFADPAADAAAHLFMEACQGGNLANPERIRAWASDHHLPEVTDPKGREIYAGNGPDGIAWWVHQESTDLILAIRSPAGSCAVFAEPLDPVALGQIYDMLMTEYAKKLAVITPIPDKAELGAYGTRTGKVRLVNGPDSKYQLLFTLITNEKAGGPYQGTLQVSYSNRSK